MAAKDLTILILFSLVLGLTRGKDSFSLEEVETLIQRSVTKANAELVKYVKDTMSSMREEISELKDRMDKMDTATETEGKTQHKRLILDGNVDTEQAVILLEKQIQALQNASAYGATYTRWGRTVCPSTTTELVYSGYAGGSWWNSNGGSNYLCLTSEPIWDYYVEGKQRGSDVYGAEYEHYDYSSTQFKGFFGRDLINEDVPCAVCRSSLPSTIMIPGRNQCYPGWTKEYSGYLVSGSESHGGPTEFVCMDGHPEAIPHGNGDNDGAIFYLSEANCGSLTCPPYVDGRELTCVVCSK